MLGQRWQTGEEREGGKEGGRRGREMSILSLVLTSLGRKEGGGEVRGVGGEPEGPLALNYLKIMEGGGREGEMTQPQTFNSPQSPEMRTPVCFSCWAGPPPGPATEKKNMTNMNDGRLTLIIFCLPETLQPPSVLHRPSCKKLIRNSVLCRVLLSTTAGSRNQVSSLHGS